MPVVSVVNSVMAHGITFCILQANRYFSKNVRGKVASLVRETALCEYGKMVNKTDHTYDTLWSGEAPNPVKLLYA